MPEFPRKYKSRSFKTGGPTGEIVTKMVLEDGTVLGPDAKPISGSGAEAKAAIPEEKPIIRRGRRTRVEEAASRYETKPDEEN